MDDVMICPVTCGLNFPVINDPPPQETPLAKFVTFFRLMVILWSATIVYLLIILKKSHDDCSDDAKKMVFLSASLLVMSIGTGVPQLCLYLHAGRDQDPGRCLSVRVISTIFYDTGLMAGFVAFVTLLFPPPAATLWVKLTIGIGIVALILFTLLDCCKACAASNVRPAAPNHTDPAASASTTSTSPARVEFHSQWEGPSYVFETQEPPFGFDGISSCFTSGV